MSLGWTASAAAAALGLLLRLGVGPRPAAVQLEVTAAEGVQVHGLAHLVQS